MRRLIGKRITAGFLAAAMLLLAGCSGQESAESVGDTAANAPREKSMGRYVEQELTLPEELTAAGTPVFMQQMENGELAAVSEQGICYRSADQGDTWQRQETSWEESVGQESYLFELIPSPLGGAAALHGELVEEEDLNFHTTCQYLDAEGTVHELVLPEEEGYLNHIWFDQKGQLYGSGMNGGIYRLSTEGAAPELLLEIEGILDYACVTGQNLVMSGSRGIVIYDMDAGQIVADKVLEDFLGEEDLEGYGTSDSPMMVLGAGEEEGVVYLAMGKGLYRHVIGGAALEQVVDGSLTTMGDPQMTFRWMGALPDGQFLILFGDGTLCRYSYDPSIPTVPEEEIRVYSLAENYTIRQAASLFQKRNPEIYVKYEVGMSGEDGVTAEDAIRNLNTRLMSGNGPDILVLNGLPAGSYGQKGILADLTQMAEELTEEEGLFSNILEAGKEDGKLFSMPVRFRIPMLVGDEGILEEISDLSSLADTLEALRKEQKQGGLLGLDTAESLLYTLSLVYSDGWMNEDGSIKEEALADFLAVAKRIYQTETAGMEEETPKAEQHFSGAIIGSEISYASASGAALGIFMEERVLGAGTVKGIDFDFNTITSVARQIDGLSYQLFQGQEGPGFLPSSQVGICAGSAQRQSVTDFFRFLFQEELQNMELPDGFPVSRSAFLKLMENPRSGMGASGIAMSSDDGPMFSLDVEWSEEEDFQRLLEMAESLTHMYAGDDTIVEAVLELGPDALNGTASVEETAAEIVKKAAIYLAE